MAVRGKAGRAQKKTGKAAGTAKAPAKSAGKKAASGGGARAAAKRPATIETVARRIVRVTVDPTRFDLAELYAENCTSAEPGGVPVVGHAGIEQKMQMWEQMQEQTSWRAVTVFTRGNRIGIEWEADVQLRDGRTIRFEEFAVHEIKGGKIVNERYYYDRAQFAPPPEEPMPEPEPKPEPEEPEEPEDSDFTPPDPLDL